MFGTRGLNRLAHPALALVLAGAIGVLALAGCSDDNSTNPPGGGIPSTTTFFGMFASGTESGRLSATVNTTTLAPRWNGLRAPKAIVTAAGAAVINGSTYTLLGTYDTSTNEIDMTGGGYTFTGQYSASAYGRPGITGDWTGPGGAGDVGEFVCYLGTLANVKAYCGTYGSAADSGGFSFTVIDTILAGVAHPFGAGAGAYFEGKVTGSSNPRVITINYTNTGNYTLLAPGTVDTVTGAVAGTYTYTDIAGGGANDDAGTYTGDLCP